MRPKAAPRPPTPMSAAWTWLNGLFSRAPPASTMATSTDALCRMTSNRMFWKTYAGGVLGIERLYNSENTFN